MRVHKKLKSNLVEDEKDKKKLSEFLFILSVCHDIFPEENDGEITYQGSSPDEVSLVKGAALLGFKYKSKINGELLIQDEISGKERRYLIKSILPFDSYRKRMSVIVYNKEENKYELFIKGADTVMMKLIKFKKNEIDEIKRIDSILSHKGLRILMMAKKKLKEEEVESFIESARNLKNDKVGLNKNRKRRKS